MAEDALSAIGGRSEALLEKVSTHRDLTNAFMAMLWIMANTATSRGARVDGIEVGTPTMTENRIRVHVNFHTIAIVSNHRVSAQGKSLAEHIGMENRELFTLIRANPSIPDALLRIVELMDAYARDKGKKFPDIKFQNGFMDGDDNFVLEIMKD